MAYYLAIDIGASSGRHMLGRLVDGKLELEEIYRFPNGMVKQSGSLCWDMQALFQEVLNGLEACAKLGKIPTYMGIDTWAVDYVLLDGADKQIGEAIAYRDHRTKGMDARVYEKISETGLYQRTGIQKLEFNTIYQLMADDRLKAAQSMLMIPDYLNFLLTGAKASEYTNATSTQLIHAKVLDWDWELIERLGYPKRLFQPLKKAGSVLGGFKEDIAERLGFDCTVLLPATHDTASAVVAVPSNEEEVLYLSSGTWSLMGVEREVADCSPQSQCFNFTNEGGYAHRFRYLKNIMGLWMVQSLKKELHDRYSFSELCQLASQSTLASRVDCQDNRFLAPDSMIAQIQQACRETGQAIPSKPGDLAAVAYNSLADCYAKTAREIEVLTKTKYKAIHIIGGGANAAYLNEATARATGKTVYAGPVEATAIGNLAVQMLATGEFETLSQARETIARTFEIKAFEVKDMITSRYEQAKARYAEIGVDTDKAIQTLQEIPISIHCWQGDDVTGFEGSASLSGGIAATGNYPGKARSPHELMADLDKALSLIPGTHRVNIHANYAIFEEGEQVGRTELEPKHFSKWVEWAKVRGLGLDFNPTYFSHELSAVATLSSEDPGIRGYWVEHGKRSIKIAEYFATELGSPSLLNIWIPDGFKDIPADRMGPRARLKESLDEIIAMDYDKSKVKIAVESKVFGIGMESYTVGSHEFYMNYAAQNGLLCLLDNGHYHPTETVSDKISSMLLFSEQVALHVTRPVRWDSDHIVLLDDETKEIAKEIIRHGHERVILGLDFFDASVNRIAAWVIGVRNTQKALLNALLMPHGHLKGLQDSRQLTELLMTQEELKTFPMGDVWDYFCKELGVGTGMSWFAEVQEYEQQVLSKRGAQLKPVKIKDEVVA
ncbi:MAG: L-rhamnose isomerase [Turicibacter sp.]|nr:L-rhamnose isomerase [Turicibacter sp.]